MFSFCVTAKCLFKQAGPGENCEISKDYLHPFLTMLSTETFEDQSSEPCEMPINRLDSNISSLLWNRKYNYWSRSPFIIYSGSSWFWAELRILQSLDSTEKSQLFWGAFYYLSFCNLVNFSKTEKTVKLIAQLWDWKRQVSMVNNPSLCLRQMRCTGPILFQRYPFVCPRSHSEF